jgi:hypothetical protein
MTKRDSAKPSGPVRSTKRSISKLSPAHPNGLKGPDRAGRAPAHPGPSRHNPK